MCIKTTVSVLHWIFWFLWIGAKINFEIMTTTKFVTIGTVKNCQKYQVLPYVTINLTLSVQMSPVISWKLYKSHSKWKLRIRLQSNRKKMNRVFLNGNIVKSVNQITKTTNKMNGFNNYKRGKLKLIVYGLFCPLFLNYAEYLHV